MCQVKTISPPSSGKLPSEITVSIRSPDNRELRSIVYALKTIFTLSESQKQISIAPKKPTYDLEISTNIPIDVKIMNGKTSWVRSSFDASGRSQKISIDMSG
jgi:DNA-binding SARP family transcriptional activator